MLGGPERLAELPAPASLQVSAWFSQGGTLPPRLLDREVCRYVFVDFGILNADCHLTPFFLFVLSAYDEYDVSPYEELKLNLVRNIEMSRMASIMAGTDDEIFTDMNV